MNSPTTQQMSARKYELGGTVLRREQRTALERIHRAVAQAWTNAMADFLPQGSALEYEELGLAPMAEVKIADSPRAQALTFALTSRAVAGFLAMSGELASFLVSKRLGLSSSRGDDASLTRIEGAIARETIRAMLARLDEEYGSAGLGELVDIQECESLADSLGYPPEEKLVMVRFQVTDQPEMSLIVGFGSGVAAILSDDGPAHVQAHGGRETIVSAVARLPIEVDLVLGSWQATLRELQQLRAGDRLVLPDGQDAWFAARGIRIGRANVEVAGNRARVEIIGNAR